MADGTKNEEIAVNFFAWWTAQRLKEFCEALGLVESSVAHGVGKLLLGKNQPLSVVQMRHMRDYAARSSPVLLPKMEMDVRARKDQPLGRQTAAKKRIGRPPKEKTEEPRKMMTPEEKSKLRSDLLKAYWARLTPRQKALQLAKRKRGGFAGAVRAKKQKIANNRPGGTTA